MSRASSTAPPALRRVLIVEDERDLAPVLKRHVEGMSPNYEADPERPKVVAPEDWYKAPAQR